MLKRKRTATVKAQPVRTLSIAKARERDIVEGEEHKGEDDSQVFDPELNVNNNKNREKTDVAKNKDSSKKIPRRRPVITSKDRIKTEDENGDPIIRTPQVNSDYLPLPWKGRLGYACLNTYLRTSNPPIFCSRTCRISTILQKGSTADGHAYVESLGLQNACNLEKMIRWNEKYGIKFLRISSEMFPFASHEKYGYSLDFAAEPLGEAGRLAMKFGHRLTTHPGQYTQLASPRKEVITASVRDLEYHSQLLCLLGLEGQANRDAVMILHMGGVFGDKKATLDRFRENYTTLLSDDVKARLVLENDDVNWTVHDLLPICHELNIPLVLDYHHHNIRHRDDLREGTLDLLPFLPEIKQTWTRKNITQKQHYSEARDNAVTDRDMRKHSKRVRNLPPCDPTMDLMIEAKDKEQAVFELYRKYGIGGNGLFKDMVPHVRTDENVPEKPVRRKREELHESVEVVDNGDLSMGGEDRRVYWPEGKEDWLSPPKKIRKKTEVDGEIVVEKNSTNRQQKIKKGKGEVAVREEVKMVVEKRTIRGRQKTTQPRVEINEANPTPEATKTNPPAKRQRTRAWTKNEGEGKPGSAVIIPIVVPKRTRLSAARKATKKAIAPSPESDLDHSSPPPVSDDNKPYEVNTGAVVGACEAGDNPALSSALTADIKEAITTPQQRMFRAEMGAAVVRRRNTRTGNCGGAAQLRGENPIV